MRMSNTRKTKLSNKKLRKREYLTITTKYHHGNVKHYAKVYDSRVNSFLDQKRIHFNRSHNFVMVGFFQIFVCSV